VAINPPGTVENQVKCSDSNKAGGDLGMTQFTTVSDTSSYWAVEARGGWVSVEGRNGMRVGEGVKGIRSNFKGPYI